jgi:PhnB protein
MTQQHHHHDDHGEHHEHDHGGPESMPVTPYLVIDGAREAIAFYERAFGAEVLNTQEAPDGKKLFHVAMALNGGMVMFSDVFPEAAHNAQRSPKALGGTPVTIHLEVDSADSWWQRAIDAGATPVLPLENTAWGARYGVMEDPFGHRWSLASNVE